MNKLDRIFLVSDASYCHVLSVGGWAGGILFPDGASVFSSGPLLRVGSSNSAEQYAMARTFEWGINEGHLQRGDHVELRTDSQFVMAKLRSKKLSRRRSAVGIRMPPSDTGRDHGSPRKLIADLAHAKEIVLYIARTNGHPSSQQILNSPIAAIMHKADRMSRAHMLEQRKLFTAITGQKVSS